MRARVDGPTRWKRRWLGAALVLALCAQGCGDDEASVADACNGACGDIATGCALPATSAGDCSFACVLTGSLAPACAAEYGAVLDCARAQPLLACDGQAISVTLSGECLDPLADYLVCAAVTAATAVPTCVELPLETAACADVDRGRPRAMACVTGPAAGCMLQAGAVVNDRGVGVYCCP